MSLLIGLYFPPNFISTICDFKSYTLTSFKYTKKPFGMHGSPNGVPCLLTTPLGTGVFSHGHGFAGSPFLGSPFLVAQCRLCFRHNLLPSFFYFALNSFALYTLHSNKSICDLQKIFFIAFPLSK